MMRQWPQRQESELKTQRQQVGGSRKIQRQLEMRDEQPESLKNWFTRWWFLLGTVSAISQLLTMGRVWANDPGHTPGVLIWTGNLVLFGGRPVNDRQMLFCFRIVTRTGHKTVDFWPSWNWTVVPSLRFLLLWLQLGVWVMIIL